jgi:hypothetical protein
MGIASFSRSPLLSALFTPLHAFAALWAPRSHPSSVASSSGIPAFQRRAANDACAAKVMAKKPESLVFTWQKTAQLGMTVRPRRLKVVREFEPGIGPSCAGRMVISGRMADVCAELDRMAQRETAHVRAA